MRENEVELLIKQQRIYRVGDTTPSDMFKAYKEWLPLAEAGDAKAQFNIAYCLNTGRGVDMHRKRAAEWLEKAAMQGDMLAHYSLFLAYKNGDGVDINDNKANEHLQLASDLGDSRAFFEIGKKHFRAGDKTAALLMFNKAKDAKHRDADKGIGLTKADITFSRGSIQHEIENSRKHFTNPTLIITVKNNSDAYLVFGADLNSINERGTATRKSIDIAMIPSGETDSAELEVFPSVDVNETIELVQYRVGYNRSQPDWTMFPLSKPITLWTPEDSKQYRSSCFVVTVCMDDDMDPVVIAFRRFRDEILMAYGLGRRLVAGYYRHGPALARWVGKHQLLRSALRQFFRILAKVIWRAPDSKAL